MNILSYRIKGNTLYLVTDNPGRETFAYSKDKFKDLASLKKEINKHIAYHTEKEATKLSHLTNLKSELDIEVTK